MINHDTDCRNGCMLFFEFGEHSSVQELHDRLLSAKSKGFSHIVASYKTKGMEQAKFDEAYFCALGKLVTACKETKMTFWLEDYAPFPTGSANGAYALQENADKNKLMIDERHLDVCGPYPNAHIRLDALQNICYAKAIHQFSAVDPSARNRLAVIACRVHEDYRGAAHVALENGTEIDLSPYVKGELLCWDVPEGNWRIFVVFTTYESSGRPHFMNLLSRDSVALEIEKVHKPLYEFLKEELGETWNGFFYDEPEIGNDGGENVFDFFMLPGNRTKSATDIEVLPWSPEMPEAMQKRDDRWIEKLPYLWYEGTGAHKRFRYLYMDAVSSLVTQNYNGQVYRFCTEHAIHYFGHVLEDEGSHARLGCGPSHYFRQQYYQDEAGIDVIAGQILPGKDKATSWYGVANADGEFYHYGLAKLASSEAHINPLKKNRSAAEIFAMYGQQGFTERKFLVDHLLINGINRLLFADVPAYHAPDILSSHFVNYANRMCALLRNTAPVRQVAVLYHAEAEWQEGENAQKFHRVGAVLAQNQISYDVLPADVFCEPERYDAQLSDGLVVNGHAYEALVIPYPGRDDLLGLPKEIQQFVEQTNVPVLITDGSIENLHSLPEKLRKILETHLNVESGNKKWIRSEQLVMNAKKIYLLHNEAPTGISKCTVSIPVLGRVAAYDPYGRIAYYPKQMRVSEKYVQIELTLGRYEMLMLFEDTDSGITIHNIGTTMDLNGPWDVILPDGSKEQYASNRLEQVPEKVGFDFCGKLTYCTEFICGDVLPTLLLLGNVGDCCTVYLNEQTVAVRSGAPWLFDLQGFVHSGKNVLRIAVCSSAGNMKIPVKIFGVPMDCLTAVGHTVIEPIGLHGPIRLLYERRVDNNG